jgi:hypothetical protein
MKDLKFSLFKEYGVYLKWIKLFPGVCSRLRKMKWMILPVENFERKILDRLLKCFIKSKNLTMLCWWKLNFSGENFRLQKKGVNGCSILIFWRKILSEIKPIFSCVEKIKNRGLKILKWTNANFRAKKWSRNVCKLFANKKGVRLHSL